MAILRHLRSFLLRLIPYSESLLLHFSTVTNFKLGELTVENAPSPSTFPNLKSSGLFFFTGCDVGDVGEGAGEDVELCS